jgi:hypothetical protein
VKKAACMDWFSPSVEEVEVSVSCVICSGRLVSIVSRTNKAGRFELQAVCGSCRRLGSKAWFYTPAYKSSSAAADDKEKSEMRTKAIRRWKEIMR